MLLVPLEQKQLWCWGLYWNQSCILSLIRGCLAADCDTKQGVTMVDFLTDDKAPGPLREERAGIIEEIEKHRGGRHLVCFFNFDRPSLPGQIPGLGTQFHAEVKEALYRVLKELPGESKLDLCLYTREGDTNSVWPIVSLLREFDREFEVLAPFRCHSSGTLVALGAKKIVLGPMSELSPIDPSTGNHFNPVDPGGKAMAISVEDVQQYREFVLNQFGAPFSQSPLPAAEIAGFLKRLVDQVHPLALGNVHRVHQQIQQLAKGLLKEHRSDEGLNEIVDALTTRFYSHLHMINRREAKEILGTDQVVFTDDQLCHSLDKLLRAYEDRFALRSPFVLPAAMGDQPSVKVRFFGGVVESSKRSYAYETRAEIHQYSKIPQGVNVQVAAGQAMPLIQGLPREYDVQVTFQGWVHNKQPIGVTT